MRFDRMTPKFRIIFGLHLILIFTLLVIIQKTSLVNLRIIHPKIDGSRSLTLASAAAEVSMMTPDSRKTVIVGVIDDAYFDMMLNYRVYAEKLSLKTLYVALDNNTHNRLLERKMVSYFYDGPHNMTQPNTVSLWGTHDFNLKGVIKFETSLRLLRLNYTVLMVDFDVTFLRTLSLYSTVLIAT